MLPEQFDLSQWYNDENALKSDSLEGSVTTWRVVLGGTGPCSGASGEVIQETLGSNSTGLFNFRFTFEFTHLSDKCKKFLK